MKTGAVAKRFDVDPNTITDWTKRFSEFFTSEALGQGQIQRDYQPEDILVLNTVRVERAKSTPWEDIRAVLKSGHRDSNLPPEFTSIDGSKAVTVYAEMREIKAQLTAANQEVERLRGELKTERENAQKRIEQLIREATEWKTRYDILKEQTEEDDED